MFLLGSLPSNNPKLNKLVFFEDSNDDYIRSFRRSPNHQTLLSQVTRVRASHPDMNKCLAQASLDLVHLSASFIADASYFFHACQGDWMWERLSPLSLTARVISRDGNSWTINNLLEKAARVAAKMPLLNTMELWNGVLEGGGKGFAAVFRYQYLEHGDGRLPAVITWRGTFGVKLEDRVVQSWNNVAFRRRGERDRTFRIVVELISSRGRKKIKSHGDAIQLLQLVNEVARPVSLSQIRDERACLIGGDKWGGK